MEKIIYPRPAGGGDHAWLYPDKYCMELKKHGETGTEPVLCGNFRPGTASFSESYVSYLRDEGKKVTIFTV